MLYWSAVFFIIALVAAVLGLAESRLARPRSRRSVLCVLGAVHRQPFVPRGPRRGPMVRPKWITGGASAGRQKLARGPAGDHEGAKNETTLYGNVGVWNFGNGVDSFGGRSRHGGQRPESTAH